MVAKKSENELRTRCPECQTVLRVDREQLARRNGVARCGRCATVFLAEKYALVTAQKKETPAEVSTPPEKKSRGKKIATKSPAKRERPEERAPVGEPEDDAITVSPRTAEEMLEEARRSLFGTPSPSTRPLFWASGVALVAMLLLGQFTYYYRAALAQYPELTPAVLAFCRALGCEIEPRRDVTLIELTQSTIAPHPTVRHALRIRTSMVNRAPFTQPYPLLEVSLTDSAGQLLARRSFTANQYLARPDKAGADMSPSVLVRCLLNVTNPENKAVGYELRLVTP